MYSSCFALKMYIKMLLLCILFVYCFFTKLFNKFKNLNMDNLKLQLYFKYALYFRQLCFNLIFAFSATSLKRKTLSNAKFI